jgi:hypothetical protein
VSGTAFMSACISKTSTMKGYGALVAATPRSGNQDVVTLSLITAANVAMDFG